VLGFQTPSRVLLFTMPEEEVVHDTPLALMEQEEVAVAALE
jgi:hypothetical protein